MLLGCTEFTKAYLQVKDNPWPFIKLVNLFQKTRIGEGEVIELLRIANGYLPRVRLEYDRLKEEKGSLEAELNSWKAELNSWKAELSNTVRIYQGFCDRNLELKKREDELLDTIGKLEGTELQKTKLNEFTSEFKDNNVDNINRNPEVILEDIISTNDVLMPPQNIANNYHQNENEMLHPPPHVESSRKLIFDTKDLF
jgi:predicted nuclease with TOPRIM domain